MSEARQQSTDSRPSTERAPPTLAPNVASIITKTVTNRPWLQVRNRRPRNRGRSSEPEPMTDPKCDRKRGNTSNDLLYFQAELSGLRERAAPRTDLDQSEMTCLQMPSSSEVASETPTTDLERQL